MKARYNGAHYLEWPAELIQRAPAALAAARRDLATRIDQVRFAQFLLFRQGERLKKYGRAKSLRLIGDLPFFVSPDSSDVWANPELFLLDEQQRPLFVAGVPPGEEFRATARVRYHHPGASCVVRAAGDRLSVAFDTPQRSVTPGQALVLYDGDEVLGGGWIECADASRS